MCSFRRIQKRIFDPGFARFLGQKEREIRNWICNLGNLSPTRAICTTASQKMTCFLLFDKLCDFKSSESFLKKDSPDQKSGFGFTERNTSIISRINICIDLNVIFDFIIALTAWVGCFWCSGPGGWFDNALIEGVTKTGNFFGETRNTYRTFISRFVQACLMESVEAV